MRLENKVAVITGAVSTVGRETALIFAKEGANVVAVSRRRGELDELVQEAKDRGYPGKIISFQGDISLEGTSNGMIDYAIENFGRFDVLVINSGLVDNYAPVEDLDNVVMQRVMAVDVYGPAYAIRKAVNTFIATGVKGSIINVTSVAGITGGVSGVAYTMASHAIVGLVKNTSCFYHQHLRCNAICAGAIKDNNTPPDEKLITSEKGIETVELAKKHNTEIANPYEIAEVALFLASDDSELVNGAIIAADNGFTSF